MNHKPFELFMEEVVNKSKTQAKPRAVDFVAERFQIIIIDNPNASPIYVNLDCNQRIDGVIPENF